MATVRPESADDEDDALTGLLSAAGARARIHQWAASKRPWQAMLIGLQRFQTVNRAFGLPAGDTALGRIAERLRKVCGDELDAGWFAARIDGSAFLVASDAPGSRERWTFLAAAFADLIARPLALGEDTLRLTTRIALFRAQAGDSASHAMESMSHALTEAQSQPGRRIVWADGSRTPRGIGAAALEEDLLRALDGDAIEVLYQPQFRLADDRLTGAEALTRWQHPRLGAIGAGTLFAVAERADQTAALGRHIAGKALTAAARWPAGQDLRLSLNLTAAELASHSVAATICGAIAETGFAPSRLTLEVTEQALLGDLAGAAAVLADLARTGVRIALDDFGAGFANFRYLKLLPLDYLKLDHTLTDDIVTMPRDRAILRAIIAMARELELEVIAEGVESEAQRLMLGAEGCDYFQGFLRAAPLCAEAFVGFARQAG